MRKRQRFCTVSCAQRWIWSTRSHAQRREHGRRAGQASGKVLTAKREAAIRKMIGSLDALAAYHKGYQAGYSAGWYRGAHDVPSRMGFPRR